LTSSQTSTFTATISATPIFTPSITPSPVWTSILSCGQQVVDVFDERGELIESLCGNVHYPSGSAYSASLSAFVPNPSGLGGAITIFINNQPVAVWNAIDANGHLVPNGFYHFTIVETTVEGNKVVLARDAYITDQTGTKGLQLSVIPNSVHLSDQVMITASFAGVPADQRSSVKIYAMDGERVITLGLNFGTVYWNLENNIGQSVASGLYLIVLDGVDPVSGKQVRKTQKLLVLH
jgi:hypothetical protein